MKDKAEQSKIKGHSLKWLGRPEAVARDVLEKKVLLKVSKSSQENASVGVSFL